MNLIVTAAADIDMSQKSSIKFSTRAFRTDITGFHLDIHGGTSWLYVE